MHKKIYTKVMALSLVVMMLSSMSFGVVNISDVLQTNWASKYVQTAVENKIMPLYDDGSFKPNQNITNAEVMITIYNSAKAAGLLKTVNIAALTTKYEKDLEALKLPKMLAPYGGDLYPAIAYALENKFLVMDEVKYFISNGKLTEAKKVDVSVFFGKALNVYKNENLNKIISLSFKDAFEISLGALKYVNLLIEYNIITSNGDANGNFNPRSSINRAVLAVYVEGFYKAVKPETAETSPVVPAETDTTNEETGTTTTTTTTTTTPTETTQETTVVVETTQKDDAITIEGIITDIFKDFKMIEVKEANGKTTVYDVKNTKFYATDALVDFSTLTVSTPVKMTVLNKIPDKIILEKTYDKVEGTMVQISDPTGVAPQFRPFKIKLESGAFDFKRIYDNTVITIDGVVKSAADLKENYKVIVGCEGYDAKYITAFSENYTFTGILQSKVTVGAVGDVKIVKDDGFTFAQKISTLVIFDGLETKDANGVKILRTAFNENDIVNVTLAYGKITKIKYLGQKKEFAGVIQEIHIKALPEVTVMTDAGVLETFGLSKSAVISNPAVTTPLSIYDLRLGQSVKVNTGINGIEQMVLNYKKDVESFNCTVTNVFAATNLLIVKDEKNITRTVAFADASGLSISNYKIGNLLFIEGKPLTEILFEASNITITKN